MRKGKYTTLIVKVQLLQDRVSLLCLDQLLCTLVSDTVIEQKNNDNEGEGAKELVKTLKVSPTLKELYLGDEESYNCQKLRAWG